MPDVLGLLQQLATVVMWLVALALFACVGLVAFAHVRCWWWRRRWRGVR